MDEYHVRRSEKEIKGRKQLLDILERGKHMTIAMCREGEPYLVTVNHFLDREAMCLYFHCAQNGKKMDFLKANPVVWGQVLEDRGYVEGVCEYSYCTVMFRGRVEFVSNMKEKRRALTGMISRLDRTPDATNKRFVVPSALQGVAICKVLIGSMSGKDSELTKE